MPLRKTSAQAQVHEVQTRSTARDLQGLLQQLRSSDNAERRWAARDLAAHPEASAAIGAQLIEEADPTVREALFIGLSTQCSEAAVAALLPLLRSEDAGLRNGAIETLASMPAQVGPHIQSLLRDPDPDVRIFTVNMLGELRHADVPRWLCDVLRHDPHVNVVGAALEVLAEVGSPPDLGALHEARRRFADDPFIAFAADLAAARIESP